VTGFVSFGETTTDTDVLHQRSIWIIPSVRALEYRPLTFENNSLERMDFTKQNMSGIQLGPMNRFGGITAPLRDRCCFLKRFG